MPTPPTSKTFSMRRGEMTNINAAFTFRILAWLRQNGLTPKDVKETVTHNSGWDSNEMVHVTVYVKSKEEAAR